MRLRAAPEHAALRQGDDRHSGKLSAANIRIELRSAFPKSKFSVRVSSYGSIAIHWANGPARQDVEAVTSRYQGGYFDGMEDIYRDACSPWCEVFGGADYVSCSREAGRTKNRSRGGNGRGGARRSAAPVPPGLRAGAAPAFRAPLSRAVRIGRR